MIDGRTAGVLLLAGLVASTAIRAQDLGALLRDAEKLVRESKVEQALAVLDRAVAANPMDARPLETRAWARSLGRDYAGAIDDATKAIALAPTSARAFHERGFARFQNKDLRGARDDYDAAAKLAPRVPAIHGELGDLLMDLQEPIAAITAYDRAIALAPKWAEAWSGRGRARRHLTDFPRAHVDLRRAAELRPADLGMLLDLAGVAFDDHDDAAAVAASAKWAQRVPPARRAEALDLWGRMLWRMGDQEAAIARLREGIAACTDDAPAAPIRLALGCVLLGAGDFAAADKDLAAASHGADEALAPYVALMQWCVDAKTKGLETAAPKLLATIEAMPTIEVRERQLAMLCSRGEGDDGTSPAMRASAFEACPRLFFAAWRARCAGNEALAQRLLRRCVNTGAKDWMQWALAVVLVRASPGGAALRPSFGAQIELVSRGDAEVALVKAVVEGGAADCQGLRNDDEIVELAGVPITSAAWRAIDARAREGLDLRLTIRRDGTTIVLYLRLGLSD